MQPEQRRKSQKAVLKAPPPFKFKESDGKIDFRGTLGELRAVAKKTPYSANKAIMRAAIDSLKADDCVTSKTMVKVAFGMMPHR
jgi:hypothetical protein